MPGPNNERPLRYDKNLDRLDIRPGVERILWNVKSLLDEAGRVDERYGIKADVLQGPEVSTSRGINIFKESFDRFKSRIRKHQKETSAWNVTRWAIHDADKFEGVINRLEKFVDGLESITKSLGLLQEQRARLREEIESISDLESLRLLCDASSSHRSSQHDVSDTASRRLITVTESIAEQRTLTSTSIFLGTAHSFVTAETRPSTATKSQVSEELPLPGAWPKSVKSDSNDQRLRGPPPKYQPRGAFKPSPSCEECLEEHYKCVTDTKNESCTRCIQTRRACSFWRELKERTKEPVKAGPINQSIPVITSDSWTPPEGLPQNRRLLSGVIEKAKPRLPLSFTAGDAHYGERLAIIKNQDENYWFNHSGKILGHANSGSSAAKRMFIDLRNIRAGKVPFISAVPLNDRLDKVLASIEGPPETSYEGGIFWITVKLPENDPNAPPMMRFHTKVYHPNISPQGHICADYKEKWTSAFPAGIHRSPVKDPNALWYRAKSSDAEWTLGALLTALCGLLATPDVDDPLVPEIAQKYLEDFDGYCKNARLYTQRFATGERPDESQLLFLEDLPANLSTMESFKTSQPISELDFDVVSLQRSLREKYDDKALDALIYNTPRPISVSLPTANHSLGLLYHDQGKLAEAEQMYVRALAGYEKALGPDHTSTLDTVSNLGVLYRNQGKLAEAEQMYGRALAGKEKALGPDHTSTLDTVNNLGVLYRDQGKLAEAEQMYVQALAGYEKALGLDHTSTLDTVNNLGVLYRDQGKLAEAEQMYVQALAGYEKALGPDHTSTLDTVNNLGVLYRNQGKLAEAEQMYVWALARYEKALGPDHTSTLDTVYNLGLLYRNQGKLAEAEQMYVRALAGYEKALGPDHTSTLNTVNNLGVLYRNQGKLAEAEQMYVRALAGKEKALGPDHTSTLNTVHNLGLLYRDQGKLAEAEQMYVRALAGYEKALGPDHTSALSTVNNLESLYREQGKLAEAK